MKVGDDGGDCKLPFETDREINHDSDDDEQQGQRPVGRELFTNLRTHKFNPAQLDLTRTRSRRVRLEGRKDLLALFGAAEPRLDRKTDHYIARRPKILDLRVFVAELSNCRAHSLDLGCLGVSDLQDRSTGELDRPVQAAGRQKPNRCQKGHQRDDVQHQRVAHERDIATNSEKFHTDL